MLMPMDSRHVGGGFDDDRPGVYDLGRAMPIRAGLTWVFAAAVAWEVNEWLAWQVQYIWSSRSDNTIGSGDAPQNRASTSLRLTF